MKIIAIDNFDRGTIPDMLIAENVHKTIGKRIVDFLNDGEGNDSETYYMLVEDNHREYRGLEELI